MSPTHDYVISNASGSSVRADLNNALAAIVSNNSNASSPSTTYAYQWWADTTTGQLKLRNSANSAWITIFELDGTMLMEDGSAASPGLAFASDLNTGFFRSAADKINFATGGVERLEIGSSEIVFNDGSNDVDFRVESNGNANMLFVDGGNDRVGIGTGTVDSAAKAAISNGGAEGIEFRAGNNSGVCEFLTYNRSSNAYADLRYDAATHQFKISGQEKARIDSSGKLGIGETSMDALLVIKGASDSATTPSIRLKDGSDTREAWISNASGDLVLVNGGNDNVPHCKLHLLDANIMRFDTANTERLRIDSSGRLLLGLSSSIGGNALLQVQGSGNRKAHFHQPDTGSCITQFTNSTTGSGSTDGLLVGLDSTEDGMLWLYENQNLTFATNNTERMRIDSSGNVGIGVSGPAYPLEVAQNTNDDSFALQLRAHTTGADGARTVGVRTVSSNAGDWANLRFDATSFIFRHQGSNERMRIDSSGRLLVGTTASQSGDALVQAYKSSGNVGIHVKGDDLANGNTAIFSVAGRNASGGGYRAAEIGVYKNSSNSQVSGFIRLDPDDGSTNFIYFDNSNLLRFSTSSGNIGLATGTVIGTQTSDERLKNVGADVAYGLAEIKQLQPKQYALKTEPDTNKLGFIAQQVESIIPEAVFDSTDPLPGHEEGDRTKLGMEYVQIIPVLVNAIKELSAEVDTLKTKVAALEAG